jgi:hypothetical protein
VTPAEKLAARIPIPWADVERIASAAHGRFQTFAGVDAKDADALAQLHPLDAMQVRLAAWQSRNFGVPSMTQIVCGVVEELREWTDAESGSEDQFDAEADITIYLAQMLTLARLSLSSVVEEAARWEWHSHRYKIIRGAGILSHVALKHEQRIRGLGEPGLMRCGVAAGAVVMIAEVMGPDAAQAAILAVAPRVLARDWVASPTTGGEA